MIKPVQYGLCLSRLVGGSRYEEADLRRTAFGWADLTGSNLLGVDLSGADLEGADLRWASLWDADLREAVLYEADLWGANLSGADLVGADLHGANLGAANLLWADLRGADLEGTTKWDKKASPLVCAMAKVGAPWDCIDYEWDDREWIKPREFDHWAGLANLYMLGQEDD